MPAHEKEVDVSGELTANLFWKSQEFYGRMEENLTRALGFRGCRNIRLEGHGAVRPVRVECIDYLQLCIPRQKDTQTSTQN